MQLDRVRLIEPAPWRDAITGRSPRALRRALRRANRRGELASAGRVKQVAPGLWAVPVLRVREPGPPPPRWIRPLVMSVAALTTLGGGGWMVWLAISAAMEAAPEIAAVALIVLVAVVLWARTSSRRGCTTTVTIRHWH